MYQRGSVAFFLKSSCDSLTIDFPSRKDSIIYIPIPKCSILSSKTSKSASEKCKQAINEKKLMIFPIGIDNTSSGLQKLNDISDTPCLNMEGTKFNEFFVWLSDSLSAVTRSRPGDTIELPETDPWRHVGI